jgi:DNA-binding CsgD family transcriptional regulator
MFLHEPKIHSGRLPHISILYMKSMLVALSSSPETPSLSKRETEVLSWVVQGKRDSEIGVILEISSRTVEKHVGRILYKLGVENRTTAASVTFAAGQS